MNALVAVASVWMPLLIAFAGGLVCGFSVTLAVIYRLQRQLEHTEAELATVRRAQTPEVADVIAAARP